MDKISFKKINDDLRIVLHTSDYFKKLTSRKTLNLRWRYHRYPENNRQYPEVIIKNFFGEHQKMHIPEKIELLNDKNFVIGYDYYKDSLKLFYSDTTDTTELTKDTGYVSYGIGKETITEVIIRNPTDFLQENEVITEKCIVNNEEKEIVDFYLGVLKRYEESFSGENKDKVRKARIYLYHIWKGFPLINESYAYAIRDILNGIRFRELEECAESIIGLQRKIIRLDCLEKEPHKDKTNEYIYKYRTNRGNLTRVFDDSDLYEIPAIEKLKIIEVRNQIVRVRKILEIQYKYAPIEKKQKIMQCVTVIKNFETKKYFTSEEDKVSTFRSLLDLLEGAEGVTTLITGIPLVIIGSIVKIIKSILALNDLKKEYKREKGS